MTPAADALGAMPDTAPSLVWAVLRTLAALALLLAGAWALLRWQKRGRRAERQIEVIERAALSRAATLALVRVGGRRLLLGISGDGVRLVRDLEDVAVAEPAEFERALDLAGARREAES